MKQGAKNDTNGGRVDAQIWSKDKDTKNGAKIIKKWSNGRNQEAPVSLKYAGEKRGDGKKDLRNGHEPNKIDHQIELRTGVV